MKKVFKIGCGSIVALIVLVIVLALMGGEEDKPSTGTTSSDSADTSETAADTGAKIIDATSHTVDAVGLKVALGEIKITKNKVQVGVNVENTGANSVSFYPDQGSAVIGNMQLDANLFLTDGDVSGDIQSGVLKEGIIEYLAPDGKEIDVEALTEIKLVFGDVFDSKTFDSKEVTFTVPVK